MTERQLGTRLDGLDLRDLDGSGFAALENALARHGVIVIPEQRLTPAEQIAFSHRFGALERSLFGQFTHPAHPEITVLSNIEDAGKPTGARGLGQSWHTDFSFMERCGYATILYGIEVPPAGSDTIFADMDAAYQALAPDVRARLDRLEATHAYRLRWDDNRLTPAQLARCPDVRHPMVRRHPRTARPSLFLGSETTVIPDGMSLAEARAFMKELFDFATQARFVHRHRWQPREVLIWDNMSTLHSATPFDETHHRRLVHRTAVIGERPVCAHA